MSRKDEPNDKYCMVAVIFFILGLGTLLPWNFFITAIPYFQYRLQPENTFVNTSDLSENGTSSEGARSSGDEFNFSNWMTLLAQLPLLLCTLLNSFLYPCIPERVRIAGSMLAILFLFIVTAVLVTVQMSPQSFFDVTMATIWFINAFCAILQGSLFGLLALFPQKYSSMLLSGQGMAGTLAPLAMLLSMSSGTDVRTTALGYFIAPCFGTFISIACYLLLSRLEFAQYHISKSNAKSSQNYEVDTDAELLQKGTEKEVNGDAEGQKKAVLLLKEAESGVAGEEKPKVSICVVLKKIWVMALTLVIGFTVTLSVYPAITANVESNTENKTWRKFFNPVCCFLIFNIMDWIGRSITSYTLWPGPDCKYLPLLACCRVIFIPLFMLCNITNRNYLTTIFSHDAWFVIFMILFSVSNGYCISLPMCLAPKKVEQHEGEITGAIMTFFLALGLSLGAALSFVFKALL
ncbi:equilibrative nucleoside transporter 2 [Spea bombifrons]|uniref:equilibrative nucleoside transporter 2 n=1 Tax=Spea bombifrons TaxID=233779 RepID=UPI00234A5ED7|nr:equilibrative nucleoside transporter 2 [Spea bombifrons]XP_053304366.1 equilibrative nucleoside transporter 2 [Spea bombifrons]